MKKGVLINVIVLLMAGGVCFARTITVDDDGLADFDNIQAAISDANDGDTVLVKDGIYTGEGNRDIDFLGKAITVKSENGPETCIIDCNGTWYEPHRGFFFGRDEDANSVLDGLTITNGYSSDGSGGGIHCEGSSPIIKDCIITENSAEDHIGGGVIHCEGGSPAITGCTIRKNWACDSNSAGIYCYDSCPTIINCTISENRAGGDSNSAGIYFLKSTATVENCTISETSSRAPGGGAIYCDRSNVKITNCNVSQNEDRGIYGQQSTISLSHCVINENDQGICCYDSELAAQSCIITGHEGGGIYCEGSSPTIENCMISENGAYYYCGGGIYCKGGSPVITNCTISKNFAGEFGGGIYCEGGSPTITNCTISENQTRDSGGGIYCLKSNMKVEGCTISGHHLGRCYCRTFRGSAIGCDESSIDIINCTLRGNSGQRVDGAIFFDESIVRITNCDVSQNSCFGISGRKGSLVVNSCSISGNSWYWGYGRGIYCEDSGIVVSNSILFGNAVSDDPEIMLLGDLDFDTYLTISYSDVKGGQEGIYVVPGAELEWGQGNIDADPCFIMAGYWDVNDTWVEGDYHLLPTSPCIDTGDPNYLPEPNETDLDDNPRVLNGRIDMGAYEFVPPVEVELKLTPQMLNCDSKGRWVKAHVIMPEEIYAEDVDVNTPAAAEPPGVESEFIEVNKYSDGSFDVQIYFDRQSFCETLSESEDGLLEVTVTGSLLDGRKFEGSDTIKLKSKPWQNRHRQNKKLFEGRRK